MKAMNKCIPILWILAITFLLSACQSKRQGPLEHPPQEPKVLNNFVTELLRADDIGHGGVHVFSITNPRDGWCFFRSSTQVDTGGQMRMTILPADSSDPAAAQEIIHHKQHQQNTAEAMRYLPEGSYKLRLEITDARLESLTVGTMPATIYANYPCGPHLREFGSYDWKHLKRMGILDACNTMIMLANSEYVGKWTGKGKHALQEAGVPGLRAAEPVTEDKAYDYWINKVGLTEPKFSGIVADEFYSGDRPSNPGWTAAIKRLRKEKPEKVFCAYLAGSAGGLRPFVEPLRDTDCLFNLERYLMEQRTEEQAKVFLGMKLKKDMIGFKTYVPDFAERCIYVLGLLSGPNETLNKNPAANYKAHMDLQFRILATDPLFKGLRGVEGYHSAYADEEYLRCFAKLLRHYCIEGNTEPLIKDPYVLTHIQNPDFEQGLDGWTVEMAAAEGVKVKKMAGYGWLQGRYPRDHQGDIFLWTRRSADGANTVSQQIKHLERGRYYSVKMYTGDYGDLTKEQLHSVSVLIEGAETIPSQCLQGVFHNCFNHLIEKFGSTRTYFNYHRVVFKAVSDTAQLVISDWDSPTASSGPIGQEMMFNFIEVEPFLMPE